MDRYAQVGWQRPGCGGPIRDHRGHRLPPAGGGTRARRPTLLRQLKHLLSDSFADPASFTNTFVATWSGRRRRCTGGFADVPGEQLPGGSTPNAFGPVIDFTHTVRLRRRLAARRVRRGARTGGAEFTTDTPTGRTAGRRAVDVQHLVGNGDDRDHRRRCADLPARVHADPEPSRWHSFVAGAAAWVDGGGGGATRGRIRVIPTRCGPRRKWFHGGLTSRAISRSSGNHISGGTVSSDCVSTSTASPLPRSVRLSAHA